MTPSGDLRRYGPMYVWAVIAVGLGVVAWSIVQLFSNPIPSQQWFLLASLTLVSGSATIKLPAIPASISVSETFVFTAVLLYGPAAGTLIVALDGLVMSFWIARRHQELSRAFFNMSAPAVSAWCSAQLFFYLAGIPPLHLAASGLDRILPALILSAITYFGINSWLITGAITLYTGANPLKVWRSNFLWLSINYFCGASVAILLVLYTRDIDIQYLGVIVPLLFVLYFTFRASLGRVEDANRHVEEVNRLYLSTMEALAMAIDAKDQVTHGHIRRVQAYAIGLARRMGVSDGGLIKAIETAALLHDMGKLAVPEHILNKPGKLTSAEFDKMKLHASIGADILSAVDFPYPVVPIVRYHHEHWDGGGYPAGLRGVEIPIGARILAVVDCFDALTSDRPYRRQLSDHDALQILVDRRGTLYDPLVVDTFVKVYQQIAPTPRTDSSKPMLGIPGPLPPSLRVETAARSATLQTASVERPSLYKSFRVGASEPNLAEIAETVSKELHDLISFTLGVIYLHQPISDELIAMYACGDGASAVTGLTLHLGDRISGWVAVNRQTIINSDPSLDLEDVMQRLPLRLRSSLSTPLVDDDHLVGVLTVYSPSADAFDESDRNVAETVAIRIAPALRQAAEALVRPKHLAARSIGYR